MKLNKETFLDILDENQDVIESVNSLSNLYELVEDMDEKDLANQVLLLLNLINTEVESLNHHILQNNDSTKMAEKVLDAYQKEHHLLKKNYQIVLEKTETLIAGMDVSNLSNIDNTIKEFERKNIELSTQERLISIEIDLFKKRKQECQEEIKKNSLEIETYQKMPTTDVLIEQLKAKRKQEKENEEKKETLLITGIENDKKTLLNRKDADLKSIDNTIQSLKNLVHIKNEVVHSYQKFLPAWKFFNFFLFGALDSSILQREKIISSAKQEITALNSTNTKCENLKSTLDQENLTLDVLKEIDFSMELPNKDEEFDQVLKALHSYNEKLIQLDRIQKYHISNKHIYDTELVNIDIRDNMRLYSIKHCETNISSLNLEIESLPKKIEELKKSYDEILKEISSNKVSVKICEELLDILKENNEKISNLRELEKLAIEVDPFIAKDDPSPTIIGASAAVLFKPEAENTSNTPASQGKLPLNPKS